MTSEPTTILEKPWSARLGAVAAPRGKLLAALLVVSTFALGALPQAAALGTSVGTTNASPVITEIVFYNDGAQAGGAPDCFAHGEVGRADPDPVPGQALYVCARVTDLNGYRDVCEAGALRGLHIAGPAEAPMKGTPPALKIDGDMACQTGRGTVASIGGFIQAPSAPFQVVVSVIDVAGASVTLGVIVPVSTAAAAEPSRAVANAGESVGEGRGAAPGGLGATAAETPPYTEGRVSLAMMGASPWDAPVAGAAIALGIPVAFAACVGAWLAFRRATA